MKTGRPAGAVPLLQNHMETLDFTQNWNGKLLLDVFGTVRLHNPIKYRLNALLQCRLHDKDMGIVKVVNVRPFEFGMIRDGIAYLDTGKPAHYLAELLRRFYAPHGQLANDTMLCHVILEYTERHYLNQTAELQKWWSHKMPEPQLNLFKP